MKIKMTKEMLLESAKEFMAEMAEPLAKSYESLQKLMGPNAPSKAAYAAQTWAVCELDPSNDFPLQVHLRDAFNRRYDEKFEDKLNEQSLEAMLDYSVDLIMEILEPVLQKMDCGKEDEAGVPPWMH